MPRNRKRNKKHLIALTAAEQSKYSAKKRAYINNNICQSCGGNLTFYAYRPGLFCQICRRDKNRQNDFQPPDAQIKLQSISDSPSISFERSQMVNFPVNDQIFVQKEYTHQDTWQRRIRFSDTDKHSVNFGHYGSSYNYSHKSVFPRTAIQTPLDVIQPPPPQYLANSSYELSNNCYDFQNQAEFQRSIDQEPLNNTVAKIPPYQANLNYELSSRTQLKRKRGKGKSMKSTPCGNVSQLYQYNQLSENIMSYFQDNMQTEDIFKRKMALRSRLQQIIKKKFPGCGVFVFGSSMTGFATKTSDADMSLIFYNTKIVRNRVIRLLWELRTIFSMHRCFTKLQVINAKVAILKFQDNLSGFEIDLNINNPTGIRNSQLLRSYARLDGRVRPLVLAVKFWAREHNINDAKNGTLSSYCLGLMLIHYLQCACSPPVLPSLQVLQPDKFLLNSDVRTLELDERLPNFISSNDKNIGQLFVGFLGYYSRQFNYEKNRISVRLGCLLPRVDKMLTKEKKLRHWIDIEEPFEQVNTARAVNNPQKAAYIKSVFDDSYNSVVERGALGQL